MKISILCSKNFNNYEVLDEILNELIEESQCFLFTVICGSTVNQKIESLGGLWAKNNGAAINYIIEEDINKLINKVVREVDFIIAFYDGEDNFIRRVIMKMKKCGKHGRIYYCGR